MANLNHAGLLLAGLALSAIGAQTLLAQEAINRVELRRADLGAADGTEVVMATLEIAPGGTVPRHFHHGDEFLYVLEGGSFQAPGQDPAKLASGATLYFAREQPHGGFTVIGDTPIKVLTVHIVDKGKPLVELVE